MGSEPPEIVIIGDDGVPDEPRPPRAPRPGPRRWAALLIGGALIFALGIAVGTHLDRPGDSSDGTALSTPPTLQTALRTSSSVVTPSTTLPESESQGVTAELGTIARPSDPTATSTAPGFWTIDTDCPTGAVPLANITGATPLTGGPNLRLVAGPRASVITVPGSSVRPVLQEATSADHYIQQVLPGGRGVLALAAPCPSAADTSTIEILPDAGGFGTVTHTVKVPATAHLLGLVAGGTGTWVSTLADRSVGADSPSVRLIPADGTGKSVTLPPGFWPVAGFKDLIVGTFAPRSQASEQPGSIVQVYSLTKGGIVDQLGMPAGQFLVSGSSVIWQPVCSGRCEIHRYDIVSGTDRVIGEGFNVPGGSMSQWIAVSPDANRIVMLVASGSAPADSVYFTLAVGDVATGRLSPAYGIEMLWPQASAVFSPDGAWLFVGVPTSEGSQVFAYDGQMRRPYEVATMPGIGNGFVPLAVLP